MKRERVLCRPLTRQTPQTQRPTRFLRAPRVRSLPPPGLPAPRASSAGEPGPHLPPCLSAPRQCHCRPWPPCLWIVVWFLHTDTQVSFVGPLMKPLRGWDLCPPSWVPLPVGPPRHPGPGKAVGGYLSQSARERLSRTGPRCSRYAPSIPLYPSAIHRMLRNKQPQNSLLWGKRCSFLDCVSVAGPESVRLGWAQL